MDLDQSLAFTALLELWPGFGDMSVNDSQPLVRELANALDEANPPSRYEFARGWVYAKTRDSA